MLLEWNGGWRCWKYGLATCWRWTWRIPDGYNCLLLFFAALINVHVDSSSLSILHFEFYTRCISLHSRLIISWPLPCCLFLWLFSSILFSFYSLLFLSSRGLNAWGWDHIFFGLLQFIGHPLCLIHKFLNIKPVCVDIRGWFVLHHFLGNNTQWVIWPSEIVIKFHFPQHLINLFSYLYTIANKSSAGAVEHINPINLRNSSSQ